MMMDTMDSNITGIDYAVYKSMVAASKLNVDFYHFLDSFSESQVESKQWLIDILVMADIKNANVQLFGGWNGILITRLLTQNLNINRIHNIDLDEKSICAFRKYREVTNDKRLEFTVGDVSVPHKYDIKTDIVINTSSEHMSNLPEIIKNKNYKPECLFALQSNNMFHIDDHINCCNNSQELIKKSNLSDIVYEGTQKMSNGYNRFMVIGRV